MVSTLWIAIGLIAILVIVGILFIWLDWNRKKKGMVGEVNYRTFFIMGIVMFPIGLIVMIISFFRDYSFVPMIPIFTVGIVYLAIGWGKRETWQKK
jgi:hypothetical protein